MRLIDADALVQWCEDDLIADIESGKYNKFTEIMGLGVIDYIKNGVIPKQPTIGDRDITPEQVIAAYNVLIRYSKEHKRCNHCVFEKICDDLASCPDQWPEMEGK